MTQNINLYDPALKAKHDWLSAGTALTVVSAVLVGTVLAAGWIRMDVAKLRAAAGTVSTELQAKQTEMTQAAQDVANIKPDPKLQAALLLSQATLTQRQAALQLLRNGGLGHEQGHAAEIAAFARQSISGLWLTGVVLNQHEVALRGRAMAPDLIPAYVTRLNTESALQGRSFKALDIERPLEADAAASAPKNAAFVEFSLIGSQGTDVRGTGKENNKEAKP